MCRVLTLDCGSSFVLMKPGQVTEVGGFLVGPGSPDSRVLSLPAMAVGHIPQSSLPISI